MRVVPWLILVVPLTGCGKKEPLHQGKSAAQWRLILRDSEPDSRRDAVTAMGALKVKDAVPDLIAALKDPDEQVRARAAEALWSLGPAAGDAVSALIPLLKDRNTGIRLNAAGALG